MLYRRSAQLALQAALLLALEPQGSPRRVRDLASALGVRSSYLAKVLHALTYVGLVRGVRGPGGGVQLARSPREIYLWDVMTAVEPVREFEQCFLGLGHCNDLQPCPLHETWAPIRAQILAMLQTKSLWQFATEAEEWGALVGASPEGPSSQARPFGRETAGQKGVSR